jgi:hypothetical protein
MNFVPKLKFILVRLWGQPSENHKLTIHGTVK